MSEQITPHRATAEALNALAAQLRQSPTPGFHLVKAAATAWVAGLLAILFPQASRCAAPTSDEVREDLGVRAAELRVLLRSLDYEGDAPAHLAAAFFAGLPEIHRQMLRDAQALEQGDPAAASLDEVIIAYPGFTAITTHRLAHALSDLGIPLLPRILSEWAHERTGIDIHPGASLGHPVIIDHGTGIVVGETAIIGNNVKIYQGVTIGALSVRKSLASVKRHPTIEDNVVIYANATILGGDTVIGRGSVIGGNVWLTASVPPDSIVSARSEAHVRQNKEGEFTAPDFVI